MHWRIVYLCALATLFGTGFVDGQNSSGVASVQARDINKGTVNFVTLDQEMALGHQMATEIERVSPFIADPTVKEYVNRVGQSIVRNSDGNLLQSTIPIRVLDSNELNAIALPGGFIFVNSGLILAMDDESELAAAIAHQIAHVAARHYTERLPNASSFGAESVRSMKFSDEMEREADYLGIQYLYQSGHDPNAMARLWEKLRMKEKDDAGSTVTLYSTHPASANRIPDIEIAVRTQSIGVPAQQYVENRSEFDRIKALLAASGRSPADSEIAPAQGEPPVLRRKGPN